MWQKAVRAQMFTLLQTEDNKRKASLGLVVESLICEHYTNLESPRKRKLQLNGDP